MADYARSTVRCRSSASSDGSSPDIDTRSREHTSTPDVHKVLVITVGTDSIMIYDDSVEGWTSVDKLFITNLSGEDVTVSWSLPTLGATTCLIPEGQPFLAPPSSLDAADVSVATTAGTANVLVIIEGTK